MFKRVISVVEPTLGDNYDSSAGYCVFTRQMEKALHTMRLETYMVSYRDFIHHTNLGMRLYEYVCVFDNNSEAFIHHLMPHFDKEEDLSDLLIVFHLPIPLSMQTVEAFQNKGATIVGILHDTAPFLYNTGIGKGMNPIEIRHEFADDLVHMLDKPNNDFKGYFEDTYGNLRELSIESFHNTHVFVTDENVNDYSDFLIETRNVLRKFDLLISPSAFYKAFFDQIDLPTIHIKHPYMIDMDPPEREYLEDEDPIIVSAASWDKFDVWSYITIVRSMPDREFILYAGGPMQDFLASANIQWLPLNLTIKPAVPLNKFHDAINELDKPIYLFCSFAAESYGMVLDEMLALDVPFVGYGNENAVSWRVSQLKMPYVSYFRYDPTDKQQYTVTDIINQLELICENFKGHGKIRRKDLLAEESMDEYVRNQILTAKPRQIKQEDTSGKVLVASEN